MIKNLLMKLKSIWTRFYKLSDTTLYKKDFSLFREKENSDLIYFDNAATTQKPDCVIDAVSNFNKFSNANPLRGLYSLSVKATEAYEDARNLTASFINAKDPCEIIFTRNATESLNLVAYSFGLENVNEGDEIVVSCMEHHSNILPWQMVCKAKKAKLVWLECDSNAKKSASRFCTSTDI